LAIICFGVGSMRLLGVGVGGVMRDERRENVRADCCRGKPLLGGRTQPTPSWDLRRYIVRYSFMAQKIYRQYYRWRQLTPDWLD
jgi:hypothetical protein